jgi:hypothetical protein
MRDARIRRCRHSREGGNPASFDDATGSPPKFIPSAVEGRDDGSPAAPVAHFGNRRTPMERFDVIVLGLGATGSAALYHLAKRRARVLGIDRFAPPADSVRVTTERDRYEADTLIVAAGPWLHLGASAGNARRLRLPRDRRSPCRRQDRNRDVRRDNERRWLRPLRQRRGDRCGAHHGPAAPSGAHAMPEDDDVPVHGHARFRLRDRRASRIVAGADRFAMLGPRIQALARDRRGARAMGDRR